MQTRNRIVGLAVLGLVFGGAHPSSAVDVTTCGQVVRGTGDLTGDLDCSATADSAVNLTGRLRLNGFTIVGTPVHDVVRCETGACRVDGPGTLTGGADAVRSDRGAKVTAVTITANAGDGVRTDAAAKVSASSITGNGGDGVRAKTRATVVDSTVSGNVGDGVRADSSVKVQGSTVDGNGGAGVDSDRSSQAKLSQITGNGRDGIRGLRVTLQDATATGNGTDPLCGVGDDCADVAADVLPKLKGASVCGTSRNTDVGGTWGVCAND